MRKVVGWVFMLAMVMGAGPLAWAQPVIPKKEFRGAWIATVSNLDWPDVRGDDPAFQKAGLVDLLDDLQAAGINAVIFQVRSEADAMYASELEPWSRFLTGTQGEAPSPLWDPLAFAIEEAHKRGMELHAWFNPFRTQSGSRSFTADNHVTVQHPEWELQVGDARLLDPGIPAARSFIIDVVADIVARYDVDGVHFDDYFYPYPPNQIGSEDNATFQQYNPQNFSSRADWRRNNINQFVKGLYERVKAIKPWVKVGASPFGIWRNGTPTGTSGLSAYDVIYADAVNWMDQQWLDYLTPQLYWAFNSGQSYRTLALWWRDQRNGRHLYPGHIFKGSYSTDELPRQVSFNRTQSGIDGSIFFRADFIQANSQGFADRLRSDFYKFKALTPTMPWLDVTEPGSPSTPSVFWVTGDLASISWQAPSSSSDWTADPRWYAVYRVQADTPPDPADVVSKPDHLVAITSRRTYQDRPATSSQPYHYIVTSVSANSVESVPSGVLTLEGRAAVSTASEEVPERVTLAPNYPNPFNPSTEITYTLPAAEAVQLVIYDLLGREVATLVDGPQAAGLHRVTWDGQNHMGQAVASGTYVFTLRTQQQRLARTMVLLK